MTEIDQHYVEPVDDQKLFESAVNGMVGELDRFSGYMSSPRAGEFQRMVEQRFGGVGIEVISDPKTKQFMVTTPIVGTPAYEAGIRAGDRIVSIDGHATRELSGQEAIKMIQGEPGQPVTLEILHEGDTQLHKYRLVRAEIKVESVLGDSRHADDTWDYFLSGQDRIGYLRISSFGDRTVDEVKAALEQLSQKGMRGLILDLRENPGGLLNAAASVAGLFLNQGDLIVATRGRDRISQDERFAETPGPYRNLPLVVIVNSNSASAAEIVAAALQDHHRAIVVGERSYGKGTVQNVIPIEGGRSVLKLTTATYWRPSGKNIHRLESSKRTDEWGVKPDSGCEVPLSKEQLADWQELRQKRDVIRAKTTLTEADENNLPYSSDSQLMRTIESLEQEIETHSSPKAA